MCSRAVPVMIFLAQFVKKNHKIRKNQTSNGTHDLLNINGWTANYDRNWLENKRDR